MNKSYVLIALCILLSGCGKAEADGVFTDNELDILDAYGLADKAQNKCANPATVKKMLKSEFKKQNFNRYCELQVDNVQGVNDLIGADVSNKDIETYTSLSYFNDDNLERYLKYDGSDIKQKVIAVNMNLDKKPYKDANVISSVSKTTMINKYNRLSSDYKPQDLVTVNSIYTSGDQTIKLNKEAYKKMKQMIKAAEEDGVEIKISEGYLAYKNSAQGMINTTLKKDGLNKNTFKKGYNEHQSGYALDVEYTHKKEAQKWIEDNAYKYGFIIRYPKGKAKETLYDYDPNHLRYVGMDLAEKLYKNNQTMEYYYATR